MLQPIIDAFMAVDKEEMIRALSGSVGGYSDLLRTALELMDTDLDPQRIHVIDDGHYQGTLVFVIAEVGYQPYRYWTTKVAYGSCSGCDTLQAIMEDGGNGGELWTLVLHMMQKMSEIGETEWSDCVSFLERNGDMLVREKMRQAVKMVLTVALDAAEERGVWTDYYKDRLTNE